MHHSLATTAERLGGVAKNITLAANIDIDCSAATHDQQLASNG